MRVSDLLTDDMKWNTERIARFVPEFKERILNLQPSQVGAEDSFIWHPLPSGIYTTRSRYNSVANGSREQREVVSPNEFNWIKDVWNLSCSPKLKTFLWSVLRDAIPLGENLQRRGITDVRCPRCKEIESPLHIFLLCPFAKEVWSRIPLKEAVHIAAADTFSTAVVRFRTSICLPPTGVTTTVFPWVCWTIWKDQNLLVFKGKPSSPEETSSRSLALAREWGAAQLKNPKATNLDQHHTHLRRSPSIDMAPHPPLSTITTIKTDAAWDSISCKAGLAWILWDNLGKEITRGSSFQDHVASPLIAEALAVREGLRLAGNQEIANLRLHSDNLTLIGSINDKKQRKEFLGIVKDIHLLSSAFVSISFFSYR